MSEITIEKFAKMVRNHDLTYDYSDDDRVWREGRHEKNKIQAARHKLDDEECVRIWNDEVDRKLIEGCREEFYWKVKKS